MKKNITMKDIAEKLNVSNVTVSKALNDKEGVSEALREKIKQTAAQLGYRVNTAAKSMRDGYSYNIGVIIPQQFVKLEQSFYLQLYQHVSVALEKHNYSGIMHVLSDEDEKSNRLPKIYEERKVDGFIILGQTKKDYLQQIKHTKMPIVYLDFYDEFDDVDSIITDNFFSAYELTNYLIRNGHKEIGFIGTISATSSIQDRFLGYYKSLLEHEIPIDHSVIIDDRDEQGAYTQIKLPEKLPTAFVCNCDHIAYHFVKQLQAKGYNVPDDYSVVSFDNDIHATLTEPNLTTVEINIKEMANMAAKFVIEKVKGLTIRYGRVSVKGNIIYRDSVQAR